MILRALACDYDGTLAQNDRIGPEALGALGEARAAGLRLVLVTGRTFFDLIRVCEHLELFDAVVAENGAVLYHPGPGIVENLAPPPPARLLTELDRRGLAYQPGRIIVGMLRADEAAAREVLAATGVGLDLVYNRGHLMLLPAGVSKATGIRRALRSLGLSRHDVLGVGDAENDLDLFEGCGFSACPADAVPALRDRADWVLAGADGQAVAEAIRGPILRGELPVDRSPRQRLQLGWSVATSQPVGIPARGQNLLIQGDPLSGKSWLCGGLVERLVDRRYATCVLDPEGDYAVLAELPGVTWTRIREPEAPDAVNHVLRIFDLEPSACLIVDLSALAHRAKVAAIQAALAAIDVLRRRHGRPHWVVLDEAHYLLRGEGVSPPAGALEAGGFCFVTYRASWLGPAVARALDAVVLTRTTGPEELAFLHALLADWPNGGDRVTEALPGLPLGEFLLVRRHAVDDGLAVTFRATPRSTQHVRHQRKYADTRVDPARVFVFRYPDGREVATAESLHRFRDALANLPDEVVAHHAGRGDFSRWVLDIFSDRWLATRLRKVETRWRHGEVADLREALDRPIALRYGDDA